MGHQATFRGYLHVSILRFYFDEAGSVAERMLTTFQKLGFSYRRLVRRLGGNIQRKRPLVLYGLLFISFYLIIGKSQWILLSHDLGYAKIQQSTNFKEDLEPVPVVLQRNYSAKDFNVNFKVLENLDSPFSLFAKYNRINIEYNEYEIKLPNFGSSADRYMFLRDPSVNETLGFAPREKRTGQIFLIKDGVFVGNINCGYTSDMIPFRRHSSKSKRTPMRDEYIVPLVIPEGDHFQHFIDGVLPKLVQVLHFVRDIKRVRYLIRSPLDQIIKDMLLELGITPNMTIPYLSGYIRSQVQINTCITPPMHPDLFLRIRKLLKMTDFRKTPASQESSVILILRQLRKGKRGLLNGDEVQSFLRSRYSSRLKVVTDIRSLSPAKEIFQNASIIIGVHGGALYNILFAQRDAAVVEIVPTRDDGMPTPPNLSWKVFWQLAQIIGQQYWRILEPAKTHLGNVNIDISKLSVVLDNIDANMVSGKTVL